MDEQTRYIKAKRRVEAIKGFYLHLLIFIVVNAGLIFLNLYTSPDNLWFFWPLFGWGIGLFFNAIGVFGSSLMFGKKWEEKKIRQFMEKDQ